MCEITEILDRLPSEIPTLMSYADPEINYGMQEFDVKQGRMIGWKILDDKSCSIYHTNFSPNTVVHWHKHDNSWERIICLRGKITIELKDGTQYNLTPHHEIRIEKQIPHKAITYDERTWIVAINVPRDE